MTSRHTSRNLLNAAFALPLLGCALGHSAWAESWHYPDWAHRAPFYFNSATPHEINGQPIMIEGLIDTTVLGSKARNDLGDLRFTWYDADTGQETPLDHYLSRATQHTLTDVYLSGDVRVGRGTGVGDSLHVNATHMRNNPGAYYFNDRVYMAYTVRGDNKNAVDLIVYDADSKSIEGPVRIADLLSNPTEEQNEHRAPIVLVDMDGYIHLVYGAHGGNMNLFYRRSVSPEDISAFTPETTIDTGSNTYPNILQLADGSIYVFSRVTDSGSWELSYYRSTDGGQTWSGEQRFVNSEGWVAYHGAMTAGPDGNSIHVVWHWFTHALTGVDRYQDVLYTWSDDGGQTWKKADGTSLGSSMSRLTSDLDVVAEGTNLWVYDVDIDSLGRPHIIYGNVGAPYRLFHAYWDTQEEEWASSQVTAKNYAWGNIRIYPDDEIRINILERLNTFTPSALRSFDFGETWEHANVRYRHPLRSSSPEMPRPSGVVPPISSFWGSNSDFEGYGPLFMYPSSPEFAQGTIYMYYGNESAERSDVAGPSEMMDFSDDFSSLSSLPSDWNVTTMGNGTVTLESGVGVAVVNPDSTENGRAAIDRTLASPLTHGYYRTRVRLDDNSQNHYIATVQNEAGEWMHLLNATPEGEWRYQQEGGGFVPFPNPATYEAGTFNNVEMHWDTLAGLLRVSINGQKLTGDAGIPLPTGSDTPITRIMQRTQIGSPSSFTTVRAEAYGSPFQRDYAIDGDFPEDNPSEPNRVERETWFILD